MGKIIRQNPFSHFSAVEAQDLCPGEDGQEAGVMWTESPGVKKGVYNPNGGCDQPQTGRGDSPLERMRSQRERTPKH